MPKTSTDIIEEMVQQPSLDRFLDRNPRRLTDEDLGEYIEIQRHRRIQYIEKEQSK